MAVQVWIGEKPEHPNERRAIVSLANGLERLDGLYLLLANFSVGGRNIDLVLIKQDAIFIVELKHNPASPFRKLSMWPPLIHLGKISYGVYLWHFPVMTWMNPWVEGSHFRWPLKLFVGGGVSVLIAVVSYKLVELPFLKLKSRFK